MDLACRMKLFLLQLCINGVEYANSSRLNLNLTTNQAETHEVTIKGAVISECWHGEVQNGVTEAGVCLKIAGFRQMDSSVG